MLVALCVVGVILMFVLLTLAVGPLIMRVTPDRGDGRATTAIEMRK